MVSDVVIQGGDIIFECDIYLSGETKARQREEEERRQKQQAAQDQEEERLDNEFESLKDLVKVKDFKL